MPPFGAAAHDHSEAGSASVFRVSARLTQGVQRRMPGDMFARKRLDLAQRHLLLLHRFAVFVSGPGTLPSAFEPGS